MSDITEGIRDYLASGGLFNPEMMDHQRVRDLVIECRDEIERLRTDYALLSDDYKQLLGDVERLREVVGDLGKRLCGLGGVR